MYDIKSFKQYLFDDIAKADRYLDYWQIKHIPFKPKTQNFDLNNNYWFSEFMRQSYKDPVFVAQHCKKVGFSEVKWFDDPTWGTQAYIAYNSSDLVICFRGSEINQTMDLITDAMFWPKASTSTEEGKVHSGFQGAFNAIWPQIFQVVETLAVKMKGGGYTRRIWICGHSLGAALALLATVKLQGKARATYVYGMPRVGSKDFLKNIKSPVYRIVNGTDFVPHVPPPFFYAHPNQNVIFIERNGMFVYQDKALRALRKLKIGILKALFRKLKKMVIEKEPWYIDHIPVSYSYFALLNIGG